MFNLNSPYLIWKTQHKSLGFIGTVASLHVMLLHIVVVRQREAATNERAQKETVKREELESKVKYKNENRKQKRKYKKTEGKIQENRG